MWNLMLTPIFCALLAHSQDITDMTCTDSSRTCEAAGSVNQKVVFEKKLGAQITGFDPPTPAPCETEKMLCASIKDTSTTLTVNGKVENGQVDRFKFASTGQADLFTMLRRPAPTDPTCPPTLTCTSTVFVDVTADGDVTTTDLTLPYTSESPVPQGQDSAGTEVANVFGAGANQAAIAVKSGTSVFSIAGLINAPGETDKIEFDVSGTKYYTLIDTTGAGRACPNGLTCTVPIFVTATGTPPTTITAEDVTLPVATTNPTIKAVKVDNTDVADPAAELSTADPCDATNIICVGAKLGDGETVITLSGKIPDPQVARLEFAQSATAGATKVYTMVKRLQRTDCPTGVTCTNPPLVDVAADGVLTAVTITLPAEVSEVTPSALSGSTVINDIFGTGTCDSTMKACAALLKDTVVLGGQLEKVPIEVKAQLEGQDPWTFKFNGASGLSATFVIAILMIGLYGVH